MCSACLCSGQTRARAGCKSQLCDALECLVNSSVCALAILIRPMFVLRLRAYAGCNAEHSRQHFCLANL